MDKPFTLAEVINLVDASVADRGADFVYRPMSENDACRYWHTDTDTPGCLVGDALHRGGIPAEVLREFDGGPRTPCVSAFQFPPSIATREARQYLQWVQDEQDGETPWGEAVEIAKDKLGELK